MKSILTKYLIIVIPIITLILIILASIVFSIGKQKQNETISNLSKQIVEARSNQIAVTFQSTIDELNQIAKLPSVISMNWSEMEADLKKIAENRNETFGFLLLAEPDGTYYTSKKGKSSKNISDRDYFKAIINNNKEHFISNPKISRSTGLKVFYLAVPVKNKDNEILGTLVGVVKLETLSKIAKNMKIGKSGYGFIVDANGYIIAHPVAEYLMELNLLSSDTVGFKNLSEVGKKMIVGKKDIDFITRPDNITEMLVYQTIPNSPGWTLGLAIPEKEIYSGIDALLLVIVIGFCFAVLITFLSIRITTKRIIIRPIEQALKVTTSISKGNLTNNIKISGTDEISKLNKSINAINTNFREIVTNIENTVVSVYGASNQLSVASEKISERANEQAATTEEIATSMEEMLAMINSNTQNAELTGKTSTKSANEMKQSNDIFVKTIKSVSEISEKISIISEIADKTDILSINAAIEAARAGESGKGFSVVANEIRKLADKTKIASDEITKLSKNGQDISRIAGEKLKTAIPEIIKSAELVNNIVSAGKEQQSGVENINTSIEQLTEITNENSASAEEMSASAEELSAQAEQLKELISVFKIGNLESEQINFRTENIENKTLRKQSANRNNGFKINLSKNNISDDDYEKY